MAHRLSSIYSPIRKTHAHRMLVDLELLLDPFIIKLGFSCGGICRRNGAVEQLAPALDGLARFSHSYKTGENNQISHITDTTEISVENSLQNISRKKVAQR